MNMHGVIKIMICEQVKDKVEAGTAIIIDCRSPMEYARGKVRGSVNIPMQEIPARHHEFKDKKSYVYCASGNRSGQVAAYLNSLGHDSVNVGGLAQHIGCID